MAEIKAPKTFEENLRNVIAKLKAPKSQFNSFGKYNYRNCEDILEAVKPLLDEHKLRLKLSDDVVQVGNYNYVKATATVTDGVSVENASALAREPEEQKGMNDAQITGSASSYARKYALNGLFDIDDTKDADTNEQREQVNNAPEVVKPTGAQMIKIKSLLGTLEVFDESREKILEQVTTLEKADDLIKQLNERVIAKKEPIVQRFVDEREESDD